MGKFGTFIDRYFIYLIIGFVAFVVKELDVIGNEQAQAMDHLVVLINISSLVVFCTASHAVLSRYVSNIWLLHILTILIANFVAVLFDFNLDHFVFNGDEAHFSTDSFGVEYLGDLKFCVTYWLFSTLIDHFFNKRKDQMHQEIVAETSVYQDGFLKEVPGSWQNTLDVIEAQENYINVYSGTEKTTILYKFKDAVAEMGPDTGLQVHRSYWVRKDAILSFTKKQGRGEIVTSSDKTVPVSRTYLRTVESLSL